MAIRPKPGLGSGSLPNSALYRETQPRGPAGRPGSNSCSGAFAAFFLCLTPFANTGNPEASVMRFLRHVESTCPMWGVNPSLSWSNGLPPTDSNSSPRTCREDHALLIVQMSSSRVFLDRVGRHQSPSPLYRHGQISMGFLDAT